MCVCVLSIGEQVPAQRSRYCDYTIWTVHQGTESTTRTFRSETYNASSVPKSLCNKIVCVFVCVSDVCGLCGCVGVWLSVL